MLTKLGNVPVGGRFYQRWWRIDECECVFQREAEDEGFITYLVISACILCRPPQEERKNGGWGLSSKPESFVEFDPLAAALEELDVV